MWFSDTGFISESILFYQLDRMEDLMTDLVVPAPADRRNLIINTQL